MARIVVLQICAAFLVSFVSLLLANDVVGMSALLGGLSCALPNALFAALLYLGTLKPDGASPITFFIGEFIKIVLTIASIMAVAWFYHDVHWLAFLVGFVLVMKSYFILLFRS